MTYSQIIFAIIATIGTSFLMILMYAVWQGLMEDTARLAIKVRKHTKR